MKTIITTLAIAALTLLGAAPLAQARSHHSSRIYISGYTSCGTPIYVERYFIGYDHCGNPVWGKRVIRPQYRPVVRQYSPPPCPATVRYDRGYRGGSVVIQGSFYR